MNNIGAMPRPAAMLIALAALVPLAGCGDDEGSSTPATTTAESAATGASGASGPGGTPADIETEDAQAKSDARAAQTAIETYAVDNAGSYEGADANAIDQISPVTSSVGVKATDQTYELTAESESGNTFTVERGESGATTRTCTEAGVGGCPENGEW